jgi:hypothetical protein
MGHVNKVVSEPLPVAKKHIPELGSFKIWGYSQNKQQ